MSTAGTWIYEKGTTTGTGDGGGGVPDAIGPVTAVTANEIGTRYVSDPDRLVHLTVGFVPVCPVPQPVTYLVSPDNGATWTWIGAQRMQTVGQTLHVDRLAPGVTAQWRVATVAGNIGGDPSPIPDASLNVLYPGVVRSAPFTVLGLSVPASSTGITATIGSCSNVVSADGFTQYGSVPGVVYTDPTTGTAFFVRITVQILDASFVALAPEQAYGGTQITGGSHTEKPLLITYVPNLAWVRYRFYLANRNSQGGGDFSDPSTNTLEMVKFNGNPVLADHYDVRVTVPAFTPIDPDAVFSVVSVTASEVGPKYQDEKQGLHTSVGIIPRIDIDYSSPRTVTVWLDFGTGTPIWQGWFALISPGQILRLGDRTVNTQGVPNSGDIYVPANTARGNWIVYCGAGHIDKGVNPSGYKSFPFTVVPVAPCLPNGTTAASFLPDPATSDPISYSKWDPGIWYWEYFCLTWTPPTLVFDPNYWFTLVTVQKGAIIGGVWTPAPDSEGINEDPNLNFKGRAHVEIMQLPGVANNQSTVIRKFGARPSTWVIPPAKNDDLSDNLYRTFRFWIYNVSRLGTDTSGSGGAGTYTLQTTCWGGADHFDLSPQPKNGSLNLMAANPKTIALPLTGGNGLPLTIDAYNPATGTGGIGGAYLGPQSVQAVNMAKDSITAANQALAASSVVDPNLVSMGINKVTYGVSVFAGDVVLSRGISKPVIDLANNGIFLYGQADSINGKTGVSSLPYVAIQNTAIGLFQGAPNGGSVYLDAVNNAITIYTKNGDLTQPYLTIAAGGISAVNGGNSVNIGTNAMSLIDKVNQNRLDMDSAGFRLTHGLNSDGSIAPNANQMVILVDKLQFIQGGSSRITIDSNPAQGITISNGGSASVQITASTVTITNGSLSSPTITSATLNSTTINSSTINGGSLNITTSQGTVTISNSTSGVQVSDGGTNVSRLNTSVIAIYSGSIGSEMSPTTLLVGRFSLLSIGLNSNDGSMHIGSKTVIDANQVWRQSVQCVDHIIGNDFGINGVGFGVGTPGAPRTFTSADGHTVTVVGGIITAITP